MSNGKNRELDKQYYTIYKVTNLIDNKIYIGFHSTNDIDDGYMGSGKYIKRAISKHGIENFEKEILFVYDNQKEAEEKEAELVNEEFVSREDTYNLTVGGNVCILRGEDNGFYGKTHNKETIEQIQGNNSGYKHSDETKAKIGKASKKMWADKTFRSYMSSIRVGREHDEETKEKIRASNKETWSDIKLLDEHSQKLKGRVFTEEAKQNMSNAQRKRFDSMTEEEYQEGYNDTFTEERNKKLSESHKGKKCSWNEKTNKDPEKIRKTAETHRGMKRSDEAKKNMSESAKGKKVSKETKQNMSEAQKGKRGMNKDGIVKMIYPNQIQNYINDGWLFGRK